MDNKICVYAICKNESQFVDRWYESMKEADEIIVLDTGSTDDTVEQLKKYPKIKVAQKIYKNWRFDTPRNDAMDLASEDVDIFVSTDLDEVLEPGWSIPLKQKWNPEVHTRAEYRYAWSHTESGEPARVFDYNKIHNKDWRWIYPVHELLARDGSCDCSQSETLFLFNEVFLHHYPDPTKSRSSYLPLLELRNRENPYDDWYGKLYLAHEYHYQGLNDKCVAYIREKLLPNLECFANIEQANIYLFLGDAYMALGDGEEAAAAWSKAIEIDIFYREPYLRMAQYFNDRKLFNIALGYVQEAERTSKRYFSWLEQDDSWNSTPNDIKAIAHYYLGHYDLAYEYGKEALAYEPSNIRFQSNLEYYAAKVGDCND
jgi:glycosyltransferase involved in cell wall biosynthesis